MLERFKKWLRGDYNSLRYRFWSLPLEWAEYIFFYRLRGKSWIEFYAARIDRGQVKSAGAEMKDVYKAEGAMHLDFLKSQGMEPSHKLLDYGCGILRSGAYFVKYLEPGNYTGVDISAERLERGKELLSIEGIDPATYRVLRVGDCHLRELDGMTFDYIFANSVLTHMPVEDIRTMLAAMRNILAPNGAFYFTFNEDDQRQRRNIKDFWYPREEIKALCEEAGYTFKAIDGWPKTDTMAVAALKND